MSKIVLFYLYSPPAGKSACWLILFFRLFSWEGSQTILTKNTRNQVLTPGAAGSRDNACVIEPAVLFDGNQYRIWYTAEGVPVNLVLCNICDIFQTIYGNESKVVN